MREVTPPHPKTFAQLYCEQHNLPLADFERDVVGRTLHPQARVLHRLLHMMPGDYFCADLELARNVGQLTRPEDFAWEVSDFHAHPSNRQMLRRRLKVRLSIALLRRLVVTTFKTASATTPAPNAESPPVKPST